MKFQKIIKFQEKNENNLQYPSIAFTWSCYFANTSAQVSRNKKIQSARSKSCQGRLEAVWRSTQC